jgi:allantoinase
MLLDLVRETPARTHVLHLSAAEALEPLARGKAEKLPLSAETCPHYLFFAAEEIPDGATEWKCAPPIRPLENRERLWQALESGLIDSVASDHSPAPPASKCRDSGDFRAAWGGIASLELALPAVWTGATARRIGAERLADWMCAAPARLAGLFARKGAIAPGFDADFVVWRPEETFRVEAPRLRQRHKLTPYAGRTLAGVVEATYLRGEKIFDRGAGLGRPAGRLLAPSGGAA